LLIFHGVIGFDLTKKIYCIEVLLLEVWFAR
jgi:hypothetical protein